MALWIKMRTNLVDDPRVGRIALVCSTTETTVLGALFILWSIADQHSTDGHLPFMTEEWLDRRVGLPGFSEALRGVGWLGTPENGSEGLLVPAFDEHNGGSAKRRAMEAARKGRVRKASASDADKKQTPSGTRAEQSREEEKSNNASKGKSSDGSAGIAPARLVRAQTLLTNCKIGERQRGEASKLLATMARAGQDPCTFMRGLIDRAEQNTAVVNKGGWMMNALRHEVKGLECDTA